MKKIIANVFILFWLLTGCTIGNTQVQAPVEVSIQYEWMSGISPVTNNRTGGCTTSISQKSNGFECTDTGCYWMCGPGVLLYSDHGSDDVILLCGRPDCPHSNMTCNAYFSSGNNVCWYDGHLYVVRGTDLIRLDPDGSNRLTLLSSTELTNKGGRGSWGHMVWNDVFTITLWSLDDQGELVEDQFYTTLDSDFSTMKQMSVRTPAQTDGEQYIVMDLERSYLQLWNPETNALSDLTPSVGRAFYGAEECWYIEDGIVYRNIYADEKTEAMLDTGLDGDLGLLCFPDCFVVINYAGATDEWIRPTEQILRFYNWNMEPVGELKLDYPGALTPYIPICGETAERFYLSDNMDNVPRYYIEKADLGTGGIQLHRMTLPENIEQMLDTEDGLLLPIGG